ncbi:MAG: adenine-specific DNA-methyltransferase [Verrucomicrobiales bacterium]|jgi:adenine-specific DNA-methyltransferase
MGRLFAADGLNQAHLCLLDAGAGVGSLTAAWTETVLDLRAAGQLPDLRKVSLLAWESDRSILPALNRNIEKCADVLRQESIECEIHVANDDFIAAAVSQLGDDLFDHATFPALPTHAILNPPYKKIASASQDRKLLTRLGIETSNLYSAFVWLSMRLLQPSGELVAITPRSFCNGPYFRPFRSEIVDTTAIRRVHVFTERGKLFGRDSVLQENVVYHLQKKPATRRKTVISEGNLDSPLESKWDSKQVLNPKDPELFVHLTPGSGGELKDFMQSLPCRLEDLGIEVSTGPVVDFRLKESLRRKGDSRSVPLLYPNAVTVGGVERPPQCSDEQPNARLQRKPVAIENNKTTERWLVPVDRFVLIKRFTSKEERRRVVAGVLDPAKFPKGLVGIENHLNFFHRNRRGLPENLATGLAIFLNSPWLDQFFRRFNGHTQVNATDLRNLRFPCEADLIKMGKALADWSTPEITSCVQRVLNPPPLEESEDAK